MSIVGVIGLWPASILFKLGRLTFYRRAHADCPPARITSSRSNLRTSWSRRILDTGTSIYLSITPTFTWRMLVSPVRKDAPRCGDEWRGKTSSNNLDEILLLGTQAKGTPIGGGCRVVESALGQKRTWRERIGMSALGQKRTSRPALAMSGSAAFSGGSPLLELLNGLHTVLGNRRFVCRQTCRNATLARLRLRTQFIDIAPTGIHSFPQVVSGRLSLQCHLV